MHFPSYFVCVLYSLVKEKVSAMLRKKQYCVSGFICSMITNEDAFTMEGGLCPQCLHFNLENILNISLRLIL